MMYAIAVLLLVIWLLGMALSMTMGGGIHVFVLLAAIVTMLRVFRVFQGPPPQLHRN